MMDIRFQLSEDDFPQDQRAVVARNLGIEDSQMSETLCQISKAAIVEYLQMLHERGMPSKADEVLQERLYYLIKYYFVDELPKESQLQSIFQITSTKSKSLLKNTRSRYRPQIEAQIKSSVRAVLGNPKPGKNGQRLVIQSQNILDEMNEVISEKGPTLQKLTASRGSASMYECADETYELLKTEFGV